MTFLDEELMDWIKSFFSLVPWHYWVFVFFNVAISTLLIIEMYKKIKKEEKKP